MNSIESLLIKGAEYHELAKHLHIRGIHEVMEETKILVRKIIDEGKTFEDVMRFCESVNGICENKVNLSNDKFLTMVREIFELFWSPRQWTIQYNEQIGWDITGPLPRKNESVPAIEQAAYEKLSHRYTLIAKKYADSVESLEAAQDQINILAKQLDEMKDSYDLLWKMRIQDEKERKKK